MTLPPDALWAHGAVRAAAGRGFTLDADGIASEDIGNGWWRLLWVSGGRAVLVGFDNDYSDTFTEGPPIDLLAGAPDWLPWERVDAILHRSWPVGFVYWWDGSSWGHRSYSLEDGAELILPSDDADLLELLGGSDSVDLARAGNLPQSGVEGLDLAVLQRAGLVDGSSRPEVPAGQGEPSGRKVPWHILPELHASVVGMAMKQADERPRPVPGPSAELTAVVEYLRANGRDEIVAGYVGDNYSSFREPHGPEVKKELCVLLEALRAHEGDPESGHWLYVRVTADGDVSRAYDSLPEWWKPAYDRLWSWPEMLKPELASRTEPWRPAWEWVLDAAALGNGVPTDLCR
ncbi:hypothetical protein [Actinomadura rupiterrae]|uniref:hypothetical protein n=1 Tax=Actinomadura rupiterrae TaxID=559627 RepID=UPI0020A2F902|nr:hypothetical protein [Actinomadura rupiterrae]MCP2340029.1 hypothetical protein [Actinomadura rupiterrae]